jgi:hypothetical protein
VSTGLLVPPPDITQLSYTTFSCNKDLKIKNNYKFSVIQRGTHKLKSNMKKREKKHVPTHIHSQKKIDTLKNPTSMPKESTEGNSKVK